MAALKEAYPLETLRTITGVSLLRDNSGFLVRSAVASLFLSTPPPATFQGISIRTPRKPPTPQPRLQCLLHGIETEETTQDIKEELLRQLGEGSVLSVERFHRRTETGINHAQPLATVRVTLRDRASYNSLLSREFRLFGLLQVRTTAIGEQASPPHCSRCMQWGHRARNCHANAIARCYRCGEAGHVAASCSDQAPLAPKCFNCGGAHKTRYRGCPTHKEAVLQKAAPSASPTNFSVSQQMTPDYSEPMASARPTITQATCPDRPCPPDNTERSAKRATISQVAPTYADPASSTRVTYIASSTSAPLLPTALRLTRSVSASAIPRPIKPRPPPKPQYLRGNRATTSPLTETERNEAFQQLEQAIRVLVPAREAVLVFQINRLLIRATSPPASQ